MSKKKTASKYPLIEKAMAMMAADQGMAALNTQLADCEGLSICEERYDGTVDLPTVEKFLATLTDDQFEQFICGDLEDEAFVPVWSTPDGLMANALFEFMFSNIEGFH